MDFLQALPEFCPLNSVTAGPKTPILKLNVYFIYVSGSDILPPMVCQVPKSPTSTSAYLQNSVPKKQQYLNKKDVSFLLQIFR